MDEYVKYLDMELTRYIENKNAVLNNIRSIKLDIEQFEIRIKDFDLSKNSGEKLFLGFNNNFDNLESAKLSETKKQLEEQLITLNNQLNFNNKKIEELNNIKNQTDKIAFVSDNTIVLKNKSDIEAEEKAAEPTTKTCPYCCTEIPLKACRCPHCTSELK